MHLDNLNHSKTRQFMLDEVERDVLGGTLYLCSYFNQAGKLAYESLLRETVRNYDDHWLAESLRQRGCFNATALRRKPKGGFTEVKVPYTAADTFSEGEFNRFYARGLCLVAIDSGVSTLEIYRAKVVAVPRSESQAKIGMRISAEALLRDLRTHQGIDTALGLPSGPNSGLSVRLPEAAGAASQ